ncbi:hypothetical protein Q4485_08085 [Granulosicoccaceae sp. 1_MG-2023]|nr:hypothetical protein [Granulosicoccaceae sp. 1_MG-2023]
MKYQTLLNQLDRFFGKEPAEDGADRRELEKLQRALRHKKHKYEKRLAGDELSDDERLRVGSRLAVVDQQLARLEQLLGADKGEEAGPDES